MLRTHNLVSVSMKSSDWSEQSLLSCELPSACSLCLDSVPQGSSSSGAAHPPLPRYLVTSKFNVELRFHSLLCLEVAPLSSQSQPTMGWRYLKNYTPKIRNR